MAIHKVLGTETEYGIVIRNQPDFNPALASSLVVNSYPGERARVQWSFEEESPGRDARGFGFDGQGLPEVDSVWSTPSSPTAHGSTSTTPIPSTPARSATTRSRRRCTTRRARW